MATSKPQYDPVKTVEAMFMGSVARIAYVMKDPVNYAPATKAILAETAKKFQDALDDCEIRILDAKWYLERQLALNKARRETKAREDSAASAKRKRDEAQDAQDKAQNAANAPKRIKTQEPEEPIPTQPQTKPQQKAQQPSPVPKSAPPPVAAMIKTATQAAPNAKDLPSGVKPPDTSKVSVNIDTKAPLAATSTKPSSQEKPKPAAPVLPPERTMTQTTADEFPKATPQDTPADGNDGFTFESMFGEPSSEMVDDEGNGMVFDLDDMGGDSYGNDANTLGLQDNSLNSLLPGLESYANQAGDDTGFSMPTTAGVGLSTGLDATTDLGVSSVLSNTQPQQSQQPTGANDFSLPPLGGPNEFDDFLNDNDINFDADNNFDGDGMLNMDNMDSMENMDFDSMFS